jgi:hypothetical protein
MKKRRIANQTIEDVKSGAVARVETRVAVVEEKPKGSRAWLFGAYTFLLLWGIAYLVLLFTNRLPF